MPKEQKTMPKEQIKSPSRLVRIRVDIYESLLDMLSTRQKREKSVVSLTQIANEQLEKSLIKK